MDVDEMKTLSYAVRTKHFEVDIHDLSKRRTLSVSLTFASSTSNGSSEQLFLKCRVVSLVNRDIGKIIFKLVRSSNNSKSYGS